MSRLDPSLWNNHKVLLTGQTGLEGSWLASWLQKLGQCYENQEWLWPYRENGRLGGNDPYSNSKACVELVTHSAFSPGWKAARSAATILAGRLTPMCGWRGRGRELLRSLDRGVEPWALC